MVLRTSILFQSSAAQISSKKLVGEHTAIRFIVRLSRGCFHWPPTSIEVFVTPLIIEIYNCCIHRNLAATNLRTDSSF